MVRLSGFSTPVSSVCLDPSASHVAAGCQGGGVALWSIDGGQLLWSRRAHRERVTCISFSPKGQFICTGSVDKAARIAYLDKGKELAAFEHDGSLRCVAYSPDGSVIACGGDDRMVYFWELPGFARDRDYEEYSSSHGARKPDIHREMARITSAKDVYRGDKGSGDKRTEPVIAAAVSCLSFSPSGLFVAAGYTDKAIRLWRRPTGGMSPTLMAVFLSHRTAIRCLSFSNKGRWIVSGAMDASILVWDVAQVLQQQPNTKLLAPTPKSRSGATTQTKKQASAVVVTNEPFRTISGCEHPTEVVLFAEGYGGRIVYSVSTERIIRISDVLLPNSVTIRRLCLQSDESVPKKKRRLEEGSQERSIKDERHDSGVALSISKCYFAWSKGSNIMLTKLKSLSIED